MNLFRTATLLLGFLLILQGCASAEKNFDQVPRTPSVYPLEPKFIQGPLDASMTETTLRRNLSRSSGFFFGVRFLFESDAYQTKHGLAPHSGTCFRFENDATEKEELDSKNWEMKLENLDRTVSFPLELTIDPDTQERLVKEKLPFTIRGRACTPEKLPYAQGFRVTALRKDKVKPDAKEPLKPYSYEWAPWVDGVSKDLERKTW